MDVSTFVLAGWNVLITLVFGLTVVVYRQSMDKVKDQGAEIHRLGILLNRTREEVARDNVTNDEVEKITQHIDQRFNRLEEKIDRLISAKG